ncbi:ProQ/FinO family protein [Cereibacter sphaeroides]|nr:ProQ/FINO family protein [Cereibacter sphaeroides]MCE6959716.1 ProQ/FinO family protein [Cereibacter sphaeroides]MCE6974423.1 ProQ/FinO family protein [Cereibacter sphaeroides]
MNDRLYYRLRPRFEAAAPALFTERGKLPVAARHGINRDILDLMAGEISASQVRDFIWRWFARPEYLAVIARGGERFDLAGRACGVITAEERARARASLIMRLRRDFTAGATARVHAMLDRIDADDALRDAVLHPEAEIRKALAA